MNIKPKKRVENAHLARMVGKTSYQKIVWKSWKKELPPTGESVFIIIRLTNGFYSVTGEFFSEKFPLGCDEKNNIVIPPRVANFIIFDSPTLPRLFFGSKDEKRLIAWGSAETYKP